jgi:CO/xanthine dehydrogenase Mo-binding subunit
MNSSGAVANGIGQPVRRKEDFRLLTGGGSFADDVHLPELAHAAIVRSPHAHARIVSVNKSAALASTGVLAVPRAPTMSPMGSRPYRMAQGSWVRRMWPRGFEAPGRLRPATTRCRPIRPGLSASLSLSS